METLKQKVRGQFQDSFNAYVSDDSTDERALVHFVTDEFDKTVDLILDHLLNSLPGESTLSWNKDTSPWPLAKASGIVDGRNEMRQEFITLITNAKK